MSTVAFVEPAFFPMQAASVAALRRGVPEMLSAQLVQKQRLLLQRPVNIASTSSSASSSVHGARVGTSAAALGCSATVAAMRRMRNGRRRWLAVAAEPAAATPAADPEVTAVGDEIRALKEKLKGEGLSNKKVNKHPEVVALVERLNELKADGTAPTAAPAAVAAPAPTSNGSANSDIKVAAPEPVGEIVDPSSVEEPDAPLVGTYTTIRSGAAAIREFTPIGSLGVAGGPEMGSRIWVRARLAAVRVKGKSTFAVLRQYGLHTVQCVKFKEEEDGGESATAVSKFFKKLSLESVVDVCGVVVESDVSGCTQSNCEMQLERAYLVSSATPILPFLLADAQRGEAEIEESQSTDRPYVRVLPDLRLEHRWLDLRVPANNGIMRVQAAVCKFFRQSLDERGFVEIHSPKIFAGESEGGAEVFRTDYFGQVATLAQSPQIYKQMALSADMPGVFEIGPVFRAEKSNTNRHLCEFTGLDLEMPIDWHYHEVITVVYETLKAIFSGIEEECKNVLPTIRKQYPSTAPKLTPDGPCIIHWDEAAQMFKDAGIVRSDFDDLSTEEERRLGAMVLEKYDTDLFFLDSYPSTVRPFYTMTRKDKPEFSNSYDLIFRGQEIGSGAQRCHDPVLLEARCAELGVPTAPLKSYIDSFRHGVPPHGGIGLGLERIVQLYLGLDNIRKASLFIRDPSRLSP